MNTIRIPANVAKLAGKTAIKSSIDEEYKDRERPLHGIVQELFNLKNSIDAFYKEADEAWKDLHAHKEPVISDKYIGADYFSNLKHIMSRLETYIDDYDSVVNK